jgi:hypothetical protein
VQSALDPDGFAAGCDARSRDERPEHHPAAIDRLKGCRQTLVDLSANGAPLPCASTFPRPAAASISVMASAFSLAVLAERDEA